MAIDKGLLDILVCPISKVPVKRLPRDRLAMLNHAIEAGSVAQKDGSSLEGALDEALMTTDGKTIYPVISGIPVMLEENGIDAGQVEGW